METKKTKWSGVKYKLGTKWCHSFVCLDVIENGKRFYIDFEPRGPLGINLHIIKRLIIRVAKRLKIGILLLDKEFFSVDTVLLVQELKTHFIIPAKNTETVKKLKAKYRKGIPCVVDYTMRSDSKEAKVKLALIKKGKKIHGFITGLNWKAEEATEFYRSRFGIETNHKKRKEFRAMTTSKSYGLRFLYFLISTVLHNLWVFVNVVINIRLHGKIDRPLLKSVLLKEYLERHLTVSFSLESKTSDGRSDISIDFVQKIEINMIMFFSNRFWNPKEPVRNLKPGVKKQPTSMKIHPF
jgi:hypothetical protein